jgi:hypothetical protein
MSALTPRQQNKMKPPPAKKGAPNSPSAVPKASNFSEAVDVMGMSDAEFNAWRQKIRRR